MINSNLLLFAATDPEELDGWAMQLAWGVFNCTRIFNSNVPKAETLAHVECECECEY